MGTADPELLVFGCHEDDLALLATAVGPKGPRLHLADSPAELVQCAISGRPLAIVLGVGTGSRAHLDMISVIRAVRSELPVIVVAEDDSLELERSARQQHIFYYLIHPIERSEIKAVLQDLRRYTRG